MNNFESIQKIFSEEEKLRDRIIYLQDELFWYKLWVWILLIAMSIPILVFFVMQFNFQDFDMQTSPSITYHDLSKEEIVNIQEILNDLKPSFYHSTNSIDFYKGSVQIDCDTEDYNKKRVGCNSFKRQIEIRFFNDIEDLKVTICHETLHNFLIGNLLHPLVYKLSETDICWKE